MENKAIDNSLENLIGRISEVNPLNNKYYQWSLRDFNNIETADRKLIINKKLTFWVHEELLLENSNFFKELLSNNSLNYLINCKKYKIKNKIKFSFK
jgi:hypothetical protein